jgi:hypothetical protein
MKKNENQALSRRRQGIVREIRRMLEPHLWESGYRKALDPSKGILGGSRPLRLWMPRDAAGKVIDRDWALGGFVLTAIQGVTEDGVMTDGFSGGLVTTYWMGIPIEDLLKLRSWLARKLPAEARTPALPLAA